MYYYVLHRSIYVHILSYIIIHHHLRMQLYPLDKIDAKWMQTGRKLTTFSGARGARLVCVQFWAEMMVFLRFFNVFVRLVSASSLRLVCV